MHVQQDSEQDSEQDSVPRAKRTEFRGQMSPCSGSWVGDRVTHSLHGTCAAHWLLFYMARPFALDWPGDKLSKRASLKPRNFSFAWYDTDGQKTTYDVTIASHVRGYKELHKQVDDVEAASYRVVGPALASNRISSAYELLHSRSLAHTQPPSPPPCSAALPKRAAIPNRSMTCRLLQMQTLDRFWSC